MFPKLTILREFFQDFLKGSTIHGFNHLAAAKRHPFEQLIWTISMLLSAFAAAKLSGLTLTRYLENPLVISMERDKFNWNTSFPAATICPSFKVEQSALDAYVQNSTATNKEALKEFLIKLSNATYENFEEVPDYPDISPDSYMDLILKLRFNFKPSISNSGVGRQYSMKQIISEWGICYTFNAPLSIYSSAEYWAQNRWDIDKNIDVFSVNPLDGEVFANFVNMSTGYKLFLHDSFDVADVASKTIVAPNDYFMQVYLGALSIYSSDRTRGLKVNQRKCRFYDESNLKRSPVYSYVLCRIECRINLAKSLCGCIPHFYRKMKGDRVCGVQGLHCLAQHKERLLSIKRECSCYTNCDEVNLTVLQLDGRAWFLGSNLQWGLKEYPRMRLKRDVIFGFTDVLVYIGGMAGLFFGCSVLSFIEIIYFFTLRLFWFCMRTLRRHKNEKDFTVVQSGKAAKY